MAVTLGQNLNSLRGIRLLGSTTEALAQTSERLASGMRLRGDSAGTGLANTLSSRAGVYTQARRNASDAISLLSIADSALGEVSQLVTRMMELAQQGASGALSKTQRIALQKEATALDQEMRRITKGTKFNGISLFSGTETSTTGSLFYDGATFGTGVIGGDARGRYVQFSDGSLAIGSLTFYDTVEGDYTSIDLSPWVGGGFVNSQAVRGYTNDGRVLVGVSEGTRTDLFLYNFNTGTYEQLTDSADSTDASSAIISADGSTVFFQSETRYLNGGTKDDVTGVVNGSPLYYKLDVATGIITTNDVVLSGASTNLAISPDGTKAVYRNNGNLQYVDLSGSTSSTPTVLTASTVSVLGITDAGKVILSSTANLAGNGNTFRQFFEIDGPTGAVTQLTSFTSTFAFNSPKMSLDGSFITFATTGNPTGENSDGSTEFFRLDRLSGEFSQITNLNLGSLSSIFFSADGSKAFATLSNGEDVQSFDLRPDSTNFRFQFGYGTDGGFSAVLSDIRTVMSGLGSIQITSEEAAQEALERLEENLDGVSTLRGNIGAALSRLESADNLISVQRDEVLAASSRIRDVDVAEETALYIRIQILQQGIGAVLVQANSQPSIALDLLGIES